MNGKLVGAVAVCLAVAACGTTREDRVGGGAAAGAATGAGIGALGGPVGALAGGAIGAGAGAVTGATTSPSDVNLGRPPWSNPEVRTPLDEDRRGAGTRRYAGTGGGSGRYASAGSGYAASGEVRAAQQALATRGFDAGAPDGVMGPQTRSAVMAFQRNSNLAATGRLDARTMQALEVADRPGVAASATGGTAAPSGRGVASTPGGTGAPGRAGATGTGGAIGPATGGGGIGPAPGSTMPGTPSGGAGSGTTGSSTMGTGTTGGSGAPR